GCRRACAISPTTAGLKQGRSVPACALPPAACRVLRGRGLAVGNCRGFPRQFFRAEIAPDFPRNFLSWKMGFFQTPHSVPLKITGQKPAEAYRMAVAGPRQSPLKIAETKRRDRSGESHERGAKLSVRRPRRKRRKRIKGPSLDPDSRGHFCPRLIGVKRKIDQKQERPSSRPMPVFPTSNLNSALRW